MDAKIHVLNDDLEVEICMAHPEEYVFFFGRENKVCKLLKSLYG